MRSKLCCLAAALLAVALVACGALRSDPSDAEHASADELLLRSYAVHPGLEERMVSALSRVLRRGEETVGRALLGPGDIILVLAPEGIHDGIEAMIRQLEDAELKLEVPKTVEITYWLVAGRPQPESARPVTFTDRRLHEIDRALETITSHQGPMDFELLERFKASSNYGQRAKVNGRVANVTQLVTQSGSRVVGEVGIRLNPYIGGVDTRITLRLGQVLILGESGIGKRGIGDVPEELRNATLFYVLRPSVVDAG